LLERGAHELLAPYSGHLAHLPVDVTDHPERIGRHQRVDVRFNEPAVVLLRLAEVAEQPLRFGEVPRDHRKADGRAPLIDPPRDRDEGDKLLTAFFDSLDLSRPLAALTSLVEDRL